jgi:hypothetical protein
MHCQMQTERRRSTRFPTSIEDFEATFRMAFGREMTADEQQYFRLSSILPCEEESNGDSGTKPQLTRT